MSPLRGRLPPDRPDPDGGGPDPRVPRDTGWTVLGYLLSGMALYGGAGWVLGYVVASPGVLFPIGMLVGLALGTAMVIFRFGRS